MEEGADGLRLHEVLAGMHVVSFKLISLLHNYKKNMFNVLDLNSNTFYSFYLHFVYNSKDIEQFYIDSDPNYLF